MINIFCEMSVKINISPAQRLEREREKKTLTRCLRIGNEGRGGKWGKEHIPRYNT